MKYTGLMVKAIVLCVALLGMMGVATAKGTESATFQVVDPLNAVIAAALALAVGIAICIKRRIQR